ncbi:ABC transporter ATP-binding protein [Devosia sp. A16]|uniref:ABC transporter ATP-binding protein n=1 Tax=Devosia sp. A16 TaxID=1736675 RepID=UPI000AE99CDB|nr:ABC transporter ATP-binding protein [Devosia sp. A16]
MTTSNSRKPRVESIPKPGQLPVVRRLLAEAIGGRRASYFGAVICMVLVAVATAALAWLMRHVVNDVLVARAQPAMWLTAGAVLAVSLTRGLADYGQTVLLAGVGNELVAGLQRRIFDKVLTLGVDDVARSHSAKLINRLIGHAGAARNVLVRISTSVGCDLLTVILLTAVMIAQDVAMGLATILVAPFALLGLNRIMRRIRDLAAREQQSVAGVIQSMQETVQGVRVVKSYAAEDAMRRRFEAASRDSLGRANGVVRIRAWTSPLMEGLGGVLIAGFILYSGWQTIAADKSAGEFIAFILAFLLAYEPAKRLAKAHVLLQRDIVGIEKMYDFLDQPEPEPDFDPRPDLATARGPISFSDVAFDYGPGRPVLDGVSLSIAPGEVAALVGASGAGKSTIAGLLQGFYAPRQGGISIGGTDISTVNRASLRRSIAVVSQDPAVFAGTVRQNIALGREGASDLEIEAAAEAAGALPFIKALPLGWDTPVSERGSTLSGGQLQRISIARALLKDAPILILDEATSALDGETERHVHAALRRLMAGRTTLLIAHRRSTVENADRVLVLDAGRIAAAGTNDELLLTSPSYRQLFEPAPSA